MTQHKWWCLLLLLTVSSSRVWTADQAAQVALAVQTPPPVPIQAAVSDPTRPPQAVLRAASGPAAPGTSAAPAPAAVAESASAVSSAPRVRLGARLTLVRVSHGKSPSVALIDGRAMTLGDRLGDWTVAGIDAQGVTLRGAKGMHRLALLSAKYEAAASSPASAASSSEKESP